jgi:hypothetical protein
MARPRARKAHSQQHVQKREGSLADADTEDGSRFVVVAKAALLLLGRTEFPERDRTRLSEGEWRLDIAVLRMTLSVPFSKHERSTHALSKAKA